MQCTPTFGESPFYSPQDRTLHFCYEWYQIVLNIAPLAATAQGVTRENVITGAWIGVLMHETGHALFDMLDVPVFGREEDAADETAAFVALQFNKDVERTIIKGFAYSFQRLAQLGFDPPVKAMDPKSPDYPKDADGQCSADPFCVYNDVHGTMSQRLYNTLCIAYGADQQTFGDFVQLGMLPLARAANCPQEYQQIMRAFAKTVFPFIDQDKLKIVQSSQWLRPSELK
jgi:Putative metallopeptidase